MVGTGQEIPGSCFFISYVSNFQEGSFLTCSIVIEHAGIRVAFDIMSGYIIKNSQTYRKYLRVVIRGYVDFGRLPVTTDKLARLEG